MKKINILFISQTKQLQQPYLDPSVRYRCYNFAQDIRNNGMIADVIPLQKFQMDMIDSYDYFIFHRPGNGNANLAYILKEIHRKGKRFHADYDDLIFAVEYALESSIFLNKVKTKGETIEIFKDNFAAFNLFDCFTASTKPLAEEINRLIPDAKVEIIPNGLSSTLLRAVGLGTDTDDTEKNNHHRHIISYFSGTESHNLDFAYIQDILADFLRRHRNFCLLVAGPLDFDMTLFPKLSVLRQRYKPYEQFFKSASQAYLNIAPLAPNNRFNECKSSLKFYESGIWAVPTVASPLECFKRFSDSDGLKLAVSLDEWDEHLERLTEADEYKKATAGLRQYCLKNCLSQSSSDKLLHFINRTGQKI